MATKIIFQGSTKTGIESELQCFANTWNEIFIQIDNIKKKYFNMIIVLIKKSS